MTTLTREQTLKLRKEMEEKYADILADENHPNFDDVRFALMAPGVDLSKINWHPQVYLNEPMSTTSDWFVDGKCRICGETANTCECHP